MKARDRPRHSPVRASTRLLERLFRATQVLVIVVVLARIAIDFLPGAPHPYKADLAPIVLFLGPVLYAACIFGATVSPASAIWLLFLVATDITLLQRGLDRWSSALEVSIIGTLAVYAGRRVERELAAHRQATAAEEARRLSETAYQTLFIHSQTAILIAGDDGIVRDANVVAAALFGSRGVIGQTLTALFGVDVGRQLLASPPNTVVVRDADDIERILTPIRTAITIADQCRLVQFVLRDVTEERKHQRRRDNFTTYVLRGEEEQRRQLAREIHDDSIQALISVCHHLDSVPHRTTLPVGTLTALEQARERVEQTVQGLRDLARGLRPSTLDDLGLVVTLRTLVDELGERTGMQTQLQVHGNECRLATEIEAGLFRITQEALRNVERHASAKRVQVDLTFGPEAEIIVRDDGKGFDVDNAQKGGAHAGLGLVGLRERATLLRGQLEIRSSLGNGTTVIVHVPPVPSNSSPTGPAPGGAAGGASAQHQTVRASPENGWPDIDAPAPCR
jgi:signal transduction histidine kinase